MSDVDKTVNIDGTEIKESEMNLQAFWQAKELIGLKKNTKFVSVAKKQNTNHQTIW